MPKLLRTRSNQYTPPPTIVALASYYPTAPAVSSTHRKVSEEDMQSSHDSSSSDMEESCDNFAVGQPQNTFGSLKRRAQSVCLVDLAPSADTDTPRQGRVVSPVTTCLSRSETLGNHGASSPTSWGLFALDEVSDNEFDQEEEEEDWSAAVHTTSFLPNAMPYYSPRFSPSGHQYHPYLKKSEKRRCIRSPHSLATPLKGFILKYPPVVCVEETTEQLSSLGL